MDLLRFVITFFYLVFLCNIGQTQVPEVQWSHKFGGTGNDNARGVTIDPFSNIYTIGSFEGTMVLNNQRALVSDGGKDVFITKSYPDGLQAWAVRAGGIANDEGIAITVDSAGAVYIFGVFFGGRFNLGSFFIDHQKPGDEQLFIGKISESGVPEWLKTVEGDGRDFAWDIKSDLNGNIFITGMFESTNIRFGTSQFQNNGYRDIFLVKYDSQGNVLWGQTFGGNDWDICYEVDFDRHGNIYLAGGIGSDIFQFGQSTLTKVPGYLFDIFIAKLDSLGTPLWAKLAGGNTSEEVYHMATDLNGNIYLTGYYSSSLANFNGIALSNSGFTDSYLARYDSDGNPDWIKKIAGEQDDLGRGVAVDHQSGNIYVSGQFRSLSFSLGDSLFSSSGGYDIYAAVFDTLGNFGGARVFGSGGDDENWGIRGGLNSGIFLVGKFASTSVEFGNTGLINSGANDGYLVKLYNCHIDLQLPDSISTCESSLRVSIDSSFNNIQWINGSGENSIDVSESGWYWVQASTEHGCFDRDSIYISFIEIKLKSYPQIFCKDDTVNLSVDTVNWSRCGELRGTLNDGLVAYFPFCGNLNDYSDNQNHLTPFGGAFVSDPHSDQGMAYSFEQGLGYLDGGRSTSLHLTQTISMGGWLWMEGGTGNPRLLSYENPEGNYRINSLGNSNQERIVFFGFGSVNLQQLLPAQTWVHAIFTYDGQTAKLYINGQLVNSRNVAQMADFDYSGSFNIGRKAAPAYDAWGGGLDEIVLYNRELSATEVRQLYDNKLHMVQYEWSTGETGSQISVTLDSPTWIWLQVTNGVESCTDSILLIPKIPEPGIRYPDQWAVSDSPLQLNSRFETMPRHWTPSIGLNDDQLSNPFTTLKFDQEYLIEIVDQSGCLITDTQLVRVAKELNIYVPSGFTPNGDGKNDLLYPVMYGIRKLNYFKIYNRWGNLVFSTNKENHGWDGRYKGATQGNDVFVWVLEAETVDGKRVSKKGTVTVVK